LAPPIPTDPTAGRRGHAFSETLIGPLLMIVAVLCFTCLDSILKHLARSHDPWFLSWARSLVQAALLLALAPLLGWRNVLVTRAPRVQLGRGLALVATSVCLIFALRHMQLTQAYAIGFSAPLIAAMLAAVLLDERPRPVQWALIAAGFLGVLVALRPDAPDASLVLLLPLGFAAANAVFQVLTRIGAQRDEHAYAQLFFAALIATAVLALGLPWSWSRMAPGEWGLLIGGGLFGTLAHFLLIAAFSRAPTALVSPMIYFQVMWAGLLGFLVFGELPAWSTVLGAAIVAAAGIALIRVRG